MTWAAESVVQENLLHSRAPVQCESTSSCSVTSEMSPCHDQKEHLNVRWEKYEIDKYGAALLSDMKVSWLHRICAQVKKGLCRVGSTDVQGWLCSGLLPGWERFDTKSDRWGEERMACDIVKPVFGRAKSDRDISCAIRISATETEDEQHGVSVWKLKIVFVN